MASLKIQAKGHVFANIYHMSLVNAHTTAVIFHTVYNPFAREMYGEHTYVLTNDYQDKVMSDHKRVYLTGAIGSTDVTRVAWEMCPYNQAHSHEQTRILYYTIVHQVTVDRTILYQTHPSSVTWLHGVDKRQDDHPIRQSGNTNSDRLCI